MLVVSSSGTEILYVQASEVRPFTSLKLRIGRGINPNQNDRVEDVEKTDLSRVSLYSVRVTSVDVSAVSTHPWCCSVDSATDEALLSLNCQGVDVGCTWSASWHSSGLYNL